MKRIDWDAVERDYRTGKFTLRELASKYGVSHQAIAKRAKVGKWTQDLGEAIRAATNARLTSELVANEVAKGGQAVANVVLAAAEVNTQVILAHRQHLARMDEMLKAAEVKLSAIGDTVADVREAKTYVDAVASAVAARKTLIEQERKAFGIDDTPPSDDDVREIPIRLVSVQ